MIDPKRCIAIALVACAVGCSAQGKVQGSVSSKGGPLGTFQVAPTKCESGAHWQFFGVAFFAEGDTGSKVEVVQDPLRGWFVKVGKPGTSKMDVFSGDECKTFDVDVHNTNVIYNRITVVEGSLKFECKQSDDGTVKGELTFSGCA